MISVYGITDKGKLRKNNQDVYCYGTIGDTQAWGITPAPLHGGPWASYADHRMATAGAIIGLRVPGVEVEDIKTTAKTLPGFEGMWAAMLAKKG